MNCFTEIESYKHKYAKKIFRQWCEKWDEKRVPFVNQENDGEKGEIYWRSNRSVRAFLEYPIVVNNKIDSLHQNWDEIWPGFSEDCRNGTCNVHSSDDICHEDLCKKGHWNGFVPTYSECKQYGLHPVAIIDVAIPSKGHPEYFVEICHANPVSNEKIEKLEKLGVYHLFEIDAEWIMKQVNIPDVLQIKRWLL